MATTAQYNNRNELTQQAGGGALPVAGTVSEPATVTVSGTAAAVNATNQFAGSVQVGTGTQNFTVVATDSSGNARTNTYQVNVSGTTRIFVYDANGNVCAKDGTTCTNGTTTYDWDAENRLVAVKQGGATLASFVYDGKGRRVQKTANGVTHTYVYDRENIIEERLSSGQTYDYVQGLGTDRTLAQRDQANLVSYYLADHLGSIVQTTTGPGTVTLTREYDPWGNMLQGSSVGGYAFTGREWDPETSIYYYRARYYEATLGRFLSADPLGFSAGPNLYAYTRNDPVRYRDPFGLDPALGSQTCDQACRHKLEVDAAIDGKTDIDPEALRRCVCECKAAIDIVAGPLVIADGTGPIPSPYNPFTWFYTVPSALRWCKRQLVRVVKHDPCAQ
jgi:RHS repeat-associated protein